MKKNEIKVGGHYTAKVSSKLTVVSVDRIDERMNRYSGRIMTVYYVTNLRTGRRTSFRSASKFRSEVTDGN